MERKIGEIFKCHDTFLQVWEAKESDGCNGCFFEEYRPLCLPYKCTAQEREDGKNVQFKQISKTMTTEEAKRRAELYSALAEGKTIQVQNPNGKWEDLKIEGLDHLYDCNKYRIKPEIKYRPFKSQEECWDEMLKHQPFGWIYNKNDSCYYCIISVDEDKIELSPEMQPHSETTIKEYYMENSYIDFVTALEDYEYTFADGTPFGIKEE